MDLLSSLANKVSFVWFVLLLFARFDHYGKVCSGDYLKDSCTTNSINLLEVTNFFWRFIMITFMSVGVMLFLIICYSCCVDPRVGIKEDDDEQENLNGDKME